MRRWLTLGVTLMVACGHGDSAPTTPVTAVAAATRPNFVVIIADDMAYGLFGAGRRFGFVELPRLERLAETGVMFDNAFVTTSLCSPSRASILSGLYAHSHGVLINDANDLAASVVTFPEVLQQGGYQTAFVGKWHMDPRTDAPRQGFDYWVSFKGQGVYVDQPLNVNGSVVQAKGYLTDVLTQYAVNWLKQRRSQPFLLMLSHKAPHAPPVPAPRNLAAFADGTMPEPASFRDPFKGKPAWERRYAQCGGAALAYVACPDPLPAELSPVAWSERDPYRLDYMRTLLALDDSVGSVLDTLAEQGLSNSTYVLFMSDNGLLLGEHRFGDKRVAYEESIRVPLVIGGAGLRARNVEGAALNIDVAPTLLDLAGLEPPSETQGRSLARVMRGQAASVRDAFVYEYYAEPLVPVVPRILAIRTLQQKYVSYPSDASGEELYDLTSDPHELTNLAALPDWQPTRDRLRQQLNGLLAASSATAAR